MTSQAGKGQEEQGFSSSQGMADRGSIGAALKPSDVLDAAAKLIEPEGAWTQGHYARGRTGRHVAEDSPCATCFCLMGAIRRVNQSGDDTYYVSRAHLARVTRSDLLIDWNDAPERTQAEVVQALRDAAELARSEGQ